MILSIETSTKVCSVCVSENNKVLAYKELYKANSHATHLTVFIQELFNNLDNITIKDIDAVAISSGPGSYTGLRIGVSVAKGICYALSKPLVSVTSLLTLAFSQNENIKEFPKDTLICPMIDARRMEVYTTLFDSSFNQLGEISAIIIDESSFKDILDKKKIIFVGDGSTKCKEIINHPNAIFIDNQAPLATNMVKKATEKFKNKEYEDVAYFEPFYLKDFVVTTSKKKLW